MVATAGEQLRELYRAYSVIRCHDLSRPLLAGWETIIARVEIERAVAKLSAPSRYRDFSA